MKLKARLMQAWASIAATLSSVKTSTDNEDRIFFAGLALVGIGAYLRFGLAVSLMACGVLLILVFRPVKGWFF
jgi:hypothetical protein